MQENRQNIAPIKANLLQYLDLQGIAKGVFLAQTNISASMFKSSGLKSELGGDKIALILSIYTNLNATWLITGKGEMLKNEKDYKHAKNNTEVVKENKSTYQPKYVELLEDLNKTKGQLIEQMQETITLQKENARLCAEIKALGQNQLKARTP